MADTMRSLRVHGQGQDKYDNVRIGMNGRLDTLQAAILLEKLAIFAEEIAARCEVARRYKEGLRDVVRVPHLIAGASSVWAQYTVTIDDRRNALAAALKGDGIPTAIYYPKPLHRQTAYQHFPTAESGLPVSERLSQQVLSLPMHAYLRSRHPGLHHRSHRCGFRLRRRDCVAARRILFFASARRR